MNNSGRTGSSLDRILSHDGEELKKQSGSDTVVEDRTATPAESKNRPSTSRKPTPPATKRNSNVITLESVANSPAALAEELVKILGSADAAAQLLRRALNHIESSSGPSKPSVTLPVEGYSSSPGLVSSLKPRRAESATEGSAFAEDEDISREQLQIIKARTMFNMVEEIDDGKCKLLFLTNPQAELIATNSESVQKMLDALEVPKPSLVIELLSSSGFRAYSKMFDASVYLKTKFAGIIGERPPFLTREDERETDAKLDMFMTNVLIPLAAQTQAVVLCDAVPSESILSASFLRMYAVLKAKWSGPPPFTVLSLTNAIHQLYLNPDEDAHWKQIRRTSRAWRQRDAKLFELFGPTADTLKTQYDLDMNASIIILTDNIYSKRDKQDLRPFGALKHALVRHLSTAVPSLAIRTGFSYKEELGSASAMALDIVSARAQAGTPVLALDVRNRPPLELPTIKIGGTNKARRAAVIEEGKKHIIEWRERLLERKEDKAPLAETFDVCTLAYLHDILNTQGDTEGLQRGKKIGTHGLHVSVPLHEAIKRVQDEESSAVEDGTIPPATLAQISEVARWHANRIFQDAWEVRGDREQLEGQGESFTSFYGEEIIYAQEVHARTLLSSPNFFHVNLSEMEDAQKLVNQIVRLDRLPPSNPLQGLLLLREAWRDYDIAMLLAGRYKRVCKAIFVLQLLVSWLVVVGTGEDAEVLSGGNNVHVVFGLAVTFSILVSLDGIMNPKARWRQLRSSAMSLQSIIWQYRTRTGPFEVDERRSDSTRPENMLCVVLKDWRDDLLARAGLKTSNLRSKYPSHVYRHLQDSGKLLNDEYHDDHHSPTQPTRYIELRVKPIIDFYALRVPKYTNHGFVLKVAILLFGVASSVLASYKMLAFVLVSTAAASALTSWAEFSEDARKVERYSSALNALMNLITWWDSLGEVEKASRESIAHLVLEAESIISEEQRSWTSTASKQESATTGDGRDLGARDETKALTTLTSMV